MQPDELTHRLWWKLGDALKGSPDGLFDNRRYDASFSLGLADALQPLIQSLSWSELDANHVARSINNAFLSIGAIGIERFYDRMESLYSEMTWELMGVVA